ncbi:hypothetical protein EYF80_051067 [Liparis tanakae]|uniref:Uncharacterized protein n=1 Tax=Liparis tanakae TaxID=230148 RepID=A0A4Z2FCY1_9TELE|nr:hypothetical protein EYF80_051067 [Liparis tanakae]
MADLVQVGEDVLGVIFEEEVGQLGVLRHSFARATLTCTPLPLLLPPPDVHDGAGIGQPDLGRRHGHFKTSIVIGKTLYLRKRGREKRGKEKRGMRLR